MNNLDGHLIAIFYFISSLEESIRINELIDDSSTVSWTWKISFKVFYVVEIYVREIILPRQWIVFEIFSEF